MIQEDSAPKEEENVTPGIKFLQAKIFRKKTSYPEETFFRKH